MANRADHVLGSKLAARQDIAAMPMATLGATVLYFLPAALLSVALSAACGAFDEQLMQRLTDRQLLAYLGLYLLADLLITQPLYFGLTQFYALRRAGARPSLATVTMCFSSLRLYAMSIRMALTIALFILLWSLPAMGLCAAAYALYQAVSGGIGWFLFYECVIVAGILLFGMISRYHCAYALLIEQPQLGCWKAVRLAAEKFRGHKREVFRLVLSFFLWFLLAMLTSGILLVVIYPYYLLSLFHLFDRVRGVEIRVETRQWGQK